MKKKRTRRVRAVVRHPQYVHIDTTSPKYLMEYGAFLREVAMYERLLGLPGPPRFR